MTHKIIYFLLKQEWEYIIVFLEAGSQIIVQSVYKYSGDFFFFFFLVVFTVTCQVQFEYIFLIGFVFTKMEKSKNWLLSLRIMYFFFFLRPIASFSFVL